MNSDTCRHRTFSTYTDEEEKNPRKARNQAQRERTHIHYCFMQQSTVRRNGQFIQSISEETSDELRRIEDSDQQPRMSELEKNVGRCERNIVLLRELHKSDYRQTEETPD